MQPSFEPKLLVAGTAFDQSAWHRAWQTAPLQQAMHNARHQFGHALCQCRAPRPLKLQIRQRDDIFHLAVWPNEGPAHDPRCLFFRDEMAEPYQARHQEGLERREPATATSGERPSGEYNKPKLVEVAQALWREGKLCSWHPAWTRDWSRVRYQLLGAAEMLSSANHWHGPDAHRFAGVQLFVPRPFSQTWRTRINQEWDAFRRQCNDRPSNADSYIVAGAVREMRPGTQDDPGLVVWLRHMNTPFVLDAKASGAAHTNSMSRQALATARFGPARDHGEIPEDVEVMAFLMLRGGRASACPVFRAQFLLVHKRTWVPVASLAEARVVDALANGHYAFEHLAQWSVGRGNRLAPDLIVRHVLGPDGHPVTRAAIDLVSEDAAVTLEAARRLLSNGLRSQGVPTWTWRVPRGASLSGKAPPAIPPLPPHDNTDTAGWKAWQDMASAHAQAMTYF